MKPTTAFIMLTGAAIGVYAINYRNGVDALQYKLNGIAIDGNRIGLSILVLNPNKNFSYPVPGLFLNVYDATGNYLGSVKNDVLQWIGKNGVSEIRAWLLPNYNQLGGLLTSLMVPGAAFNILTLHGEIYVGGYAMPIETNVNLN